MSLCCGRAYPGARRGTGECRPPDDDRGTRTACVYPARPEARCGVGASGAADGLHSHPAQPQLLSVFDRFARARPAHDCVPLRHSNYERLREFRADARRRDAALVARDVVTAPAESPPAHARPGAAEDRHVQDNRDRPRPDRQRRGNGRAIVRSSAPCKEPCARNRRSRTRAIDQRVCVARPGERPLQAGCAASPRCVASAQGSFLLRRHEVRR